MKAIIITLLALCACGACGQTVTFGYDASGNRISRVISMNTKTAAAADTSVLETVPEPREEYTDRLAAAAVTIYPNPTQGRLTVKITGLPPGSPASIALFDINGREILRRDPAGSINELDISSQPLGTCIMRITAGSETAVWKIIKY